MRTFLGVGRREPDPEADFLGVGPRESDPEADCFGVDQVPFGNGGGEPPPLDLFPLESKMGQSSMETDPFSEKREWANLSHRATTVPEAAPGRHTMLHFLHNPAMWRRAGLSEQFRTIYYMEGNNRGGSSSMGPSRSDRLGLVPCRGGWRRLEVRFPWRETRRSR